VSTLGDNSVQLCSLGSGPDSAPRYTTQSYCMTLKDVSCNYNITLICMWDKRKESGVTVNIQDKSKKN
jgi:hypothetical protein